MLTDVIRAGRADLYSIFRTSAHDCARALAIEDGSRKLTYAELLERVNRLATVFLARGVAPGDRIAILAHNRSEYLEVELAAAGIGAIVACLNWRFAPDELWHCIDLVEPVLAVVEPELSEAYRAVAATPCLAVGPGLETAIAGVEPDPRTGTMVDEPEAGLTILYTSGTTGLPKGALISHRAHIARSMVFAAQLALDPGDGFIAWAPMFHMASTDHGKRFAVALRGQA
ncbi:AMP-binding protein [Frigidibacter mobilis]|jgi:fatty-acyl-CoA synthase|uniref:Amp-dependent synthetase and ligase n=1 Tax=Frigidibacter mobilis TaxID=1335048 RepID=A0A159Z7Y9_9RHOB|nr:class I adenylate-forming enzyme family protein [Frigidibacter mobilis]AMY71541.1 amp-dependent synthetase and ligase [Frigidibacter mobilis]